MPSGVVIPDLDGDNQDEVTLNHGQSLYIQQMTALHIIASSRSVFEISFSRAKPRLLPSGSDERL
jgi:hypothetical protein